MLYHRIAATVGGMAAGAVPHTMDARQIADWDKYFEWMDTRQSKMDHYLARVCGYLSGQGRFAIGDHLAPCVPGARQEHILTADELEAALRGAPANG